MTIKNLTNLGLRCSTVVSSFTKTLNTINEGFFPQIRQLSTATIPFPSSSIQFSLIKVEGIKLNATARTNGTPKGQSRMFSSEDKSKITGNSTPKKVGESSPPTMPIKDGLQTSDSVTDFLNNLTEEQKAVIYHTLNIDVLRNKYEGHLGSSMSESHQYLSRFGRPAAAISGSEDPTGTLCEVPPKWLHARLDEKAPPPGAGAIWAVGLKNALPFIGFGFLDNLIMLLAGDYIDITLGTTFGISTMAAAALGNTISDVAGIGSAWYIEELASKIGIRNPDLTPSQMASWSIRWACNGGRAIGVVIGCLLGMIPLLFLPSTEVKEEIKEKRSAAKEQKAKEEASKDKH